MTTALEKVTTAGAGLGVPSIPPGLLPAGFTAWPYDGLLALAGETAVREFSRVVRGKTETVRPHEEMRADWPHPPEVEGHRVQEVFTHPAVKQAMYNLGNGLHAEAAPGRGPGAPFRPGKVMRSNTGLDRKALAEKGWTGQRPPTDLTADRDRRLATRQNWPGAKAQGGKLGKIQQAAAKGGGKRPAPRKPPMPWTRKGDVLDYKDHLGIDRKSMPQVSGIGADGKYHTSAEMRPKFIRHLQSKGIQVTSERIPAWSLRPTQTQGDHRAVRGIADALRSGDLHDTKPIITSADQRVIDGHHNWAGRLLADAEGGHPGLKPGLPVLKVHAPAERVMQEMREFAAAHGIQGKDLGEHAPEFQRGPASAAKGAAAKAAPGKPDALARALRQVPQSKPPKMSDEEYAAYRARLEDAIARGVGQGLETHKTETLDGDHLYKPERAAVHEEIIKSLLDKYKDVPSEGKAIIAGGLGGAGKSVALSRDPDVQAGHYATVNPDDIKTELAKRGLVPELPGMPEATPMERSSLVHEESSHVAKQLARRLQAQRKNMIWDITMSSPGGVEGRIGALRDAGYGHVHGMFVHIPVESSVQSAADRHRAGLEDARSGKNPLGERYVPSGLIRASARAGGTNANRETFEQLKNAGKFDSWSLYDRSDMKDAKLVAQGGTRGVARSAGKAPAPQAGR